MGGKTAQTQSSVTIPADVLARYNSVNAQAQAAAAQPFQQYSTNPSAFVAPVNAEQTQGIANVNSSANSYQPYYAAATNVASGAANSALPFYGQASDTINQASSAGAGGTTAAYNPLATGQNSATGLQAGALGAYGAAYGAAQPYISGATGLTTQAYNSAQPYNAGATGLALAGTQQVNAAPVTQQSVNQYLNPYLQTVLGGTLAPLIQQQQQQQSGLAGNQIMSGAFGGDRSGIDEATLAQQQNLALGQTAAGILTPAYDTALATAQQQQGVNLSAGQANRAAVANAAPEIAAIGQQGYGQGTQTAGQIANIGQQAYTTAANTGQNVAALGQQEFGQGLSSSQQQAALAQQLYGQGATTAQVDASLGQGVYGVGSGLSTQLASLGSGAQQAGLTGAQAEIGAGTVQQQTQQAGLSALYNQFQQQQGYPFQVAQFLANIAEGTGALSGSTTTSTQPVSSFLSDERAKEDIKPVGKTYDGQTIYSFRYKGHPGTQVGLLAQEVEKKHPKAVGLAGDLKTVNYDEATRDAAERGHFKSGGQASQGGLVTPDLALHGYATGGMPGFDLGSILQAQAGMYAPNAANSGGYGASIPNKPSGNKLMTAQSPKITPIDIGKSVDDVGKLVDAGHGLVKWGEKQFGDTPPSSSTPSSTDYDAGSGFENFNMYGNDTPPSSSTPSSPANDPATQQAAVNSALSAPADNTLGGLDTTDYGAGTDFENFNMYRGGLARASGGEVQQDSEPSYQLGNTYLNYMAQQRMHPFSGAGLYGNPLITTGVGGPYATMLENPNTNIKLLSADAPAAKKFTASDPSDASSSMLAQALAKARAANEGQWRGGRLHRDLGGVTMPSENMPYSEQGTGYVPEQSEPTRTLAVANAPSASSGGSGLGNLASLANIGLNIAKLFNQGGAARKGYADGSAVDPSASVNIDPNDLQGSGVAPPHVIANNPNASWLSNMLENWKSGGQQEAASDWSKATDPNTNWLGRGVYGIGAGLNEVQNVINPAIVQKAIGDPTRPFFPVTQSGLGASNADVPVPTAPTPAAISDAATKPPSTGLQAAPVTPAQLGDSANDSEQTRENAISQTLENEGPHYNPVEMNRYGIDQKQIDASGLFDPGSVTPLNLNKNQAQSILQGMWPKSGADKMDPAVAPTYFDAWFNQGEQAKDWAKQAGNDPAKFNQLRQQGYADRISRNPAQAVNQKGWANRLAKYQDQQSPSQPLVQALSGRGLSPQSSVTTQDIVDSTPKLEQNNDGILQTIGDNVSDAYHGVGLGGPKGSPSGATPTYGDDSDFMSRNQSWLVPLLKGVGAATLYPGKSLFGALTYGAQQGAESYEDIQNQMQQREYTGAQTGLTKQQTQSRQIDNLKNLQTQWMTWNAVHPDKQMNWQEFQAQFGKGTITGPTNPSSPVVSQPTAAPQNTSDPYANVDFSPINYGKATIQHPNGPTLLGVNDSGYLSQYIAHNAAAAAASPDSIIAKTVEDAHTRLESLKGQNFVTDINGNSTYAPGAEAAARRQGYNAGLIARTTQFTKAKNDFMANQYGPMNEQLNQLNTLYKNYKGGTAARDIAGLSGLVTMLDPDGSKGIGKMLPQDWQNPNAKNSYDTALKVVSSQIAQQMQGMGSGAPATEIGLLHNAVANPDLGPTARRELVVHMQALLDQKRQLYSGFNPQTDNIDDYVNGFNQNHPYYDTFVKGAEKTTPYYAGEVPNATPEQIRAEIARRTKSGGK